MSRYIANKYRISEKSLTAEQLKLIENRVSEECKSYESSSIVYENTDNPDLATEEAKRFLDMAYIIEDKNRICTDVLDESIAVLRMSWVSSVRIRVTKEFIKELTSKHAPSQHRDI